MAPWQETARTDMNHHSSRHLGCTDIGRTVTGGEAVALLLRSHLIFTLTATQRDPEIGATLRGRLGGVSFVTAPGGGCLGAFASAFGLEAALGGLGWQRATEADSASAKSRNPQHLQKTTHSRLGRLLRRLLRSMSTEFSSPRGPGSSSRSSRISTQSARDSETRRPVSGPPLTRRGSGSGHRALTMRAASSYMSCRFLKTWWRC